MAEERHPVSGQPMDVGPWERLVSALATSGVVGNPGGPELQAYRTAGGLFVRPGLGIVRGHSFFRPAADGDRQLTVAQNAGGSARLDLVTLRLDLLASPVLDLKVITGGATAPVPTRSATGVFDVPIAVASTPSGSNVPSSVQDIRDFSGVEVIPCGTVAEIAADRPRRFGTIAPESATGLIKWWNGTQWVTFSMSTHTHPLADTGYANIALIRGWVAYQNNTIPRYRRINGVVYLDGFIRSGGYGIVGSLPEGFRPSQWTLKTVSYSSDQFGQRIGRLDIHPTGEIEFANFPGANEGNVILHLSLNVDFPAA